MAKVHVERLRLVVTWAINAATSGVTTERRNEIIGRMETEPTYKGLADVLAAVPLATPEPEAEAKKGKWFGYRCEDCGEPWTPEHSRHGVSERIELFAAPPEPKK